MDIRKGSASRSDSKNVQDCKLPTKYIKPSSDSFYCTPLGSSHGNESLGLMQSMDRKVIYNLNPEKLLSVERKNSDSALSSKTLPKQNENTEYDKVITQFNDLIFELSNSESTKKVNLSQSDNLLDIMQENINKSTESIKSLKEKCIKSDICPLNNLIDLCCHKESANSFQPNAKCTSPKKEFESVDPNTLVTEKEFCKMNSVLSNQNMNESSQEVEESIRWINSHLWHLENDANKSLKSSGSEIQKENLYSDGLLTNAREFDFLLKNCSLSERHKMLNISCFPMSSLKRENITYPSSTKMKSTLYLEAFSKERVWDANFEFQRSKVVNPNLWRPSTIMLPKSSRMFRSAFNHNPSNCFMVNLFIETKSSHLGPFTFEIYPKMSLRLLKLKVEQEYGIIASSQRWILGKHFAVDNDKSLVDYNVMPGSPIILYVDSKVGMFCDTTKKNELLNDSCVIPNHDKTESNKASKEEYYAIPQGQKDEIEQSIRRDFVDAKQLESNSFKCLQLSESSKMSHEHCAKLYKEQRIIDAYENDTPDVKSPAIKKKLIKNIVQFKKKSKIKIPEKDDGHNDVKTSFIESKYLNSEKNKCIISNTLDDVSLKESSGSRENILDSVQSPLFHKNKCYNSEFLQVAASSQTGNILQSETLDIINDEEFILAEGVKHTNVLEPCFSNPELKDISSVDCSDTLLMCNSEDLENGSLPSSFGTSNLFDIGIALSHEVDKNKNAHLISNSNTNARKLKIENVILVKDPECQPLTNLNLSKIESMNKVSSQEDVSNTSNSKRSMTSILRRLSLTRKEKSKDDSTSAEAENPCFTKVNNSEITDEKNSNQPTSYQTTFTDVHIEISKDPKFSLSENESKNYLDINTQVDAAQDPDSIKNYELLLEIENMDLIQNTVNFTCPVCFDDFDSGQGVVLHDCLHTFCRNCLSSSVIYADGALVKCPYRDEVYSCGSHLQQREIKALVSEDVYEKYLQRSIITAEGLAERSFHCKTPNCPGWCIYDNAINVFKCPVCFHYNCLNCQAIHEGLNCRQYQDKLKVQQKVDQDAEKTLQFLNKMIENGKALKCPKCDLILMKKWGCDWLKCSICQTEICWITKGPRWGPGGQGDTSGGCRCGVNGVKCHPSCTYCH